MFDKIKLAIAEAEQDLIRQDREILVSIEANLNLVENADLEDADKKRLIHTLQQLKERAINGRPSI